MAHHLDVGCRSKKSPDPGGGIPDGEFIYRLGGLGGDSRNQGGYTDSWPLHGPLAGRSSGAAVTSPLQNPAPHTPAGGRISVCLCLSPRVRRSGSA